jgi:hypothetical protein
MLPGCRCLSIFLLFFIIIPGTSSTLMSDSKDLRFHNAYEPFRDLERIVSPLIHHKSWTELCIPAKEGCHLCQTFVRGQAQKPLAFQDDFDKEKDYPATQLTWESSGSGPYFFTTTSSVFLSPPRRCRSVS